MNLEIFPYDIKENGNTLTISGPCIVTGETYTVTCSIEGFNKWRQGELIQNALPSLSADDREFLISGISPKGWEITFS